MRERLASVFRLVISLEKGEFVFTIWNSVSFCGNLDISIANSRIGVKRKAHPLFFRCRSSTCAFSISLSILGKKLLPGLLFCNEWSYPNPLSAGTQGSLSQFVFLTLHLVSPYSNGFHWFVWARPKVNCKQATLANDEKYLALLLSSPLGMMSLGILANSNLTVLPLTVKALLSR